MGKETSTFRRASRIPAPPERVFAWHERPGAFERLSPPWDDVRVVERSGSIRDGDRTVLELRRGPLRRRWVAMHRDYVPGAQFADEQASGPFAAWRHVHRVHHDGPEATVLEDEISYRLPFGTAGRLVGGRLASRELERLFRFRHTQTHNDLVRHEAFSTAPMRIAITGASGLIGSALASFLSTGGHEIVRLVRGIPTRAGEIGWNPASGRLDPAALEGLDAVVHLAGAPIPKRWTETRKREILASRAEGTRLLAEALAGLERKPRVLVSGSAVGYYGHRADEELTESSPAGNGFLAEVCRAWEAAAAPAEAAGIRVVNLRTGVVLTPKGGALAKLLPAFRLFVGGPVGSGEQWLSWIGLEDVLGAIQFVLADDELRGPVNVTAPNPVTNHTFARTLGRVLGRPSALPVPGVAIRALFGAMGEESLLQGQRVLPAKLEAAGFRFLYPHLEQALRHELGRP